MKRLAETLWESAKPAGEFVAGIVVIGALLFGLSSMSDDIFVHIHVDHHWWAYREWRALWWVIVPLMMVGIGWPFRRRALGGGLWAMGAVWMLFRLRVRNDDTCRVF